MAKSPIHPEAAIEGRAWHGFAPRTARPLAALALLYASLAGLHTLQDFDLGWQLATGRWILQHHGIFSTDVFSYTAQGQPWIYPPLSGIVFYALYLAGGYGLLCWLGAACSAGTIAWLVRGGGSAQCALAVVAVPLIANRTQPRAEMFTTLLFAAFLSLLWLHYRTGKAPLWLLPALMLGWVNLHLGFAAGLAMGVAYLMLEGFAVLFPRSRQAASRRLQAAWPWLALTAAATLANPWGARLYGALVRQQQAQDFHSAWLVEWENIRPSLGSLHQALDGRDPQSAFWWLLLAAAICGLRALWRRQPGSAILLAAASYAALQHVRFQALFACVVVVVGGSILRDAQPDDPGGLNDARGGAARYASTAAIRALAMGLLGLLVGVRVFDLTSNRYYLRTSQLSSFGSGISWWFPERAVEFIEREKLPGKVFSGYDMGGYLTWRLPQYPDYVDGRAIPFGRDLFFRAYELSVEPPDSAVWRREAETRGINTILVSLARDRGIELFPQLQAFCQSRLWRPVYMDEVSAVLVRRTAATEGLVDRLQIDCQKVQFATGVKAARDKASRFNAMASAAGVLDALGRDEEALVSLDEAEGIFAGSANLHLTRGLVLEHRGRTAEAEAEFRASLELGPTEEAWLDVGLLYMTERRYGEAAEAFRRGAESSTRPHDLWMLLGQADLQMGQAQAALEAFDRAEGASPFRGGGAEAALGAGFESMVATGRAKAWYQLGDFGKAVGYQEEAVKLAPGDGKLWAGLADLYAAEGRGADAERARGRSGGR